MSVGHCHCPCGQWNHDGAGCTGQADTAMPLRRSHEGNLAVPVCSYCRQAITDMDSHGTIVPPDQR